MKKVTFRELIRFADQIGIDYIGERATALGICFFFEAKMDNVVTDIRKKFGERVRCYVCSLNCAPEISNIGIILLSQNVLDMKHTINLKTQKP